MNVTKNIGANQNNF